MEGANLLLFFVVLGLTALGLIMVYSSSFIYAHERTGDGLSFIRKQIFFAIGGFIAVIGAIHLDYRKWQKWAVPLLAVSTGLLVMVLLPEFGSRVGGAQRWLKLGPLVFQPAELAKFALILFVARQLTRKVARIESFTAGVLSVFLLVTPVLLLLLMQPDFGSAVILTFVILGMMYLAGVPQRYLFLTMASTGAAGLWLVMSSPYRLARMLTFLDPWEDPSGKGFQILQSLVGFHNGSLSGVGLGNGKEKLFFLPEAHNDFIFSVLGEELGFVGVVVLVVGFSYLAYRGLKIGWHSYHEHRDHFGLYLAVGITLLLGLQAYVNMGVVLGLLPTKGLALPFISYGGSALFVNMALVGILLSISRGPRTEKK